MLKVKQPNNYIQITRGDTGYLDISITDNEGVAYTMVTGDSLKFSVKEGVNFTAKLIEKTSTTPNFTISPTDTSSLQFKEYVYDVQLTKANGDINTIIQSSIFKVMEEIG